MVKTASEIVLVDGARTPHGTLLGSLAGIQATDLGQIILDGLLDRVSLSSEAIDWVCLGNAIQAGIGQVPARQTVIKSVLPSETPATTVNEASGSGLRAITLAADQIRAGQVSMTIAGGFESMSNAPWILPDYRSGRRYGDVTIKDSMIWDSLWDVSLNLHMGEITEEFTERKNIDRDRQDRYALESHQRAASTIKNGDFDQEIIPIETADGSIKRDEGPRPDSELSDLASLRPAFKEDGTITAGNASKLGDGAGVVLLAEADVAAQYGLEPLATLIDYEVAYRPPEEFNEAVVDVVQKILTANDLSITDIDTFWINEAFAAQSVAVMDILDIPREKMNPRGGAVAFGHPIGASGGMLTTSLGYQLLNDDIERGLVGMSIGGGGAIMALLECY